VAVVVVLVAVAVLVLMVEEEVVLIMVIVVEVREVMEELEQNGIFLMALVEEEEVLITGGVFMVEMEDCMELAAAAVALRVKATVPKVSSLSHIHPQVVDLLPPTTFPVTATPVRQSI
jgi:hypothetical protein